MDTTVNTIVGWIPTYVIDPIRARFRTLRNLGENIEELTRTAQRLDARRRGGQGKVEEAKNQEGVEASEDAKWWFGQADSDLSKANKLRTEYEQRSSRGAFSNFFRCWSDYRLSKTAFNLRRNVEKLYEEEPKSGWTSAASSSQKGRILDTVSIEGQTRTEKLKQEIIDAVVDDRYVVAGLYGMGGIGKTTLLRHVYEHFRQTDHFNSVIFTTVSATPDFSEIRKEIARGLGLDLNKCQDDNDLKEKLFRISERKKYMLILDDMWNAFDLGEIFIPAPTKQTGCKILTASRSKTEILKFAVRFGERDDLQLFQVNKLQPDEAWNLFVRKIGTTITANPIIEPFAKKVIKKCDGLPLAIVVIGATMSSRETVGEWKDAVRELEELASKFEGMVEEVFPILMFSFDKLEPIMQSLFLYCCLFPEDYIMRRWELFDFTIGEETLCDDMHKLEDLDDKVAVLIGKLINSSMLEGTRAQFKLHDVMRALGIWITSPTSNNYHIAKALSGISTAPNASEWCKATKISLMENDRLESLPQLPHLCPQLHTLLLQRCHNIKGIPQDHFLEHMPALHILDLSYTEVRNLPSSISRLVNLRSLGLRGCSKLLELPTKIGMLVQLISLDLSHCSSLRKLPKEMKEMKNLRNLDIDGAKKLNRIPDGVLSGLQNLEELHASLSGLILSTNGVMELSKLTHLTYIGIERVNIENVEVSHWFKPLLEKCLACSTLFMRNCVIDPSAMPNLLGGSPPQTIKSVTFTSCKGLTCVPTYNHCKLLTVQGCSDLKTLPIAEEADRKNFGSLEYLVLDRLDQFETIRIGVPHPEYFSNLKDITIQACPNLKVLFSIGVPRLLKNLESVRVYECLQLQNLVASDDEDLESINTFPSLKKIFLCELPELIIICHLDLKWPSLSTVHVYLCPKLKRPPFGDQCAVIFLNDEMDSKMTNDYLEKKRKNSKLIR